MSKMNDAFLEEFKRVDKLCREIYDDDRGISSYIDDMKAVPGYESSKIPKWDETLSNLKRLRHIRTQLAHEVGTMNAEMCDRRDIDWLKAFRQSILDTSDPVAVLTRRSAAQRPPRRTAPAYRQPYSGYVRQTPYSDSENKPRRSVFSTRFWIFIIIMIAIFIAVIVINHTHIFI